MLQNLSEAQISTGTSIPVFKDHIPKRPKLCNMEQEWMIMLTTTSVSSITLNVWVMGEVNDISSENWSTSGAQTLYKIPLPFYAQLMTYGFGASLLLQICCNFMVLSLCWP